MYVVIKFFIFNPKSSVEIFNGTVTRFGFHKHKLDRRHQIHYLELHHVYIYHLNDCLIH